MGGDEFHGRQQAAVDRAGGNVIAVALLGECHLRVVQHPLLEGRLRKQEDAADTEPLREAVLPRAL